MKKKTNKIRCLVNCSCGLTHTFKQWQSCRMALTPQPIKPWWSDKKDKLKQGELLTCP